MNSPATHTGKDKPIRSLHPVPNDLPQNNIFIATTAYYYKREIFPVLGFKHDFQLVMLIYIW